jgi:Ras-related protein Rab-2A
MAARISESDHESSRFTFKFIFVGDTAVGKSCIISRFRDNHFTTQHDVTVGVTFTNQTMHIGTAEVKLQLWDTAGQEIYRSITRAYYRDSDCAIVVCDLTKPETFRSMSAWIKDVRTLAPDRCKIVLVGNKIDLERRVTTDELKGLAERVDCLVFETSAKTGENVRVLLEECAMLVFADVNRVQINQAGDDAAATHNEEEDAPNRCC